MTMSRYCMLKLGILIVVTMLFPFGALAEENGEPQDIRRHCIGLLWCTEQSADGSSVDGLLWFYSSEERGSYSRLAVFSSNLYGSISSCRSSLQDGFGVFTVMLRLTFGQES